MNNTRFALPTVIAIALIAMALPAAVPVPQGARPVASQAVVQPGAFAKIAYEVSMSQPATHLFEVAIDVEAPAGDVPASVDFQMPKWQPGRYSVGDFAKNVQEFSAQAGASGLPFHKTDDQTWRVETRGNRAFVVRYKVFGNDLSGTFAQLDATHGNYNGGEIFMYVVGHKQDPVELQLNLPAGWRAINGSTDRPNQTTWRFPNYEILIDNPTEMGPDWTLDEFRLGGKTYRVVVHSRDQEGGRRPDLVRDVRRIVEAQIGMWGPPEFERYTFLFHMGDGRAFDGMEHLTSTQIMNGYPLADPFAYESVIGTASHEFFHVWNVKRLRPIELGPWDWTRPVNTSGLWIAEGFTEYYGELMMRRSGLWNDERLLQGFSETITDVENNPGNRLMSVVDASLAAPFVDATVHRQRTNLANTSVNYYTKGETIALVLDLLIRGRSDGTRSLDDVLKQMYDEFYVKAPNATYYLKGRGYTQEEFLRVLSSVAGTDMSGFYDRHIRGVETLPFDEALAHVGLRLVKTPTELFSDGIRIDGADREALRLGAIGTASPAARSGLQQGDALIRIGNVEVTRNNWRTTLDRYAVGQSVPVQVERFGRIVSVTLQLEEPQDFDYRLEEIPNASATALRLRTAWLTGR